MCSIINVLTHTLLLILLHRVSISLSPIPLGPGHSAAHTACGWWRPVPIPRAGTVSGAAQYWHWQPSGPRPSDIRWVCVRISLYLCLWILCTCYGTLMNNILVASFMYLFARWIRWLWPKQWWTGRISSYLQSWQLHTRLATATVWPVLPDGSRRDPHGSDRQGPRPRQRDARIGWTKSGSYASTRVRRFEWQVYLIIWMVIEAKLFYSRIRCNIS
jgi:hypothetical protein